MRKYPLSDAIWEPFACLGWGPGQRRVSRRSGQPDENLCVLALFGMDEPTNHLSVRERAHVNELAVQPKQQGLLVIYITHDIFQIHRIADRIVIMENGRKVTDVARDAMSAEALEGIIRDGGRAPAKGPKVA
jgi:ABC-type hemin transport system ATPase subunit